MNQSNNLPVYKFKLISIIKDDSALKLWFLFLLLFPFFVNLLYTFWSNSIHFQCLQSPISQFNTTWNSVTHDQKQVLFQCWSIIKILKCTMLYQKQDASLLLLTKNSSFRERIPCCFHMANLMFTSYHFIHFHGVPKPQHWFF